MYSRKRNYLRNAKELLKGKKRNYIKGILERNYAMGLYYAKELYAH